MLKLLELVCVCEKAAGLQRRVAELEEVHRQEREMQQQRDASLQESQLKQREEAARLEGALQEAQAQLRELGLKVSLAEARAQGLEEQLAQNDAIRSDLEHRLNVLSSALKRTLGSGRGRRSPTPGERRRSPSPWRTRSPAKGNAFSVQ